MRRVVLTILLLLTMLPQPVVAQEPKPRGMLTQEVIPCPVHLPVPGEIEGRTYDCGIVIVPENHDKPDGRTIELVYLRLRSSSLSPAPDPVVFLSGGPGGSALGNMTIPELHVTLGRMRQSRDVIAYDQRGTGFSGLLVCGPFQAALGVVAEDNPDTAAEVQEIAQGPYLQAAYYGACARGYASKGLDLSQYNSISSAHDIAALTRALGYDTYNLYGGSYGTRLAQTAMRSTPEHIRSVILDGVTSPSIPAAMRTVGKLFEQYKNIFMLCAADPICNAAYPDLEARFISLLKRIAAQPLVVDPPIETKKSLPRQFPKRIETITPDFFSNLASLANEKDYREYGRLAPRLILDAERGDTTFLRSVFAETNPLSTTAAVPPNPAQPGAEAVKPVQGFFARSIDVLLDQAHVATSSPGGPSDAWVSLVIGELRQRLLAGERQADIIRALVRLTVLPTDGLNPEVLTAYADRVLSPETAAKAKAIVSQMARHDVRLTMWRIQDIAAAMGGDDERSLSTGTGLAVNCAEEFAFITKEDAQAYLDAAPYPGLVDMPVDVVANFFLLSCTFYPPTVLTRSYIEPVVSDIPSLLFVELLDVQTPRSWGLLTREGLRNSYLVEWQTEGHVVGIRSPDGCAGDIAAAFLNDPRRQPNSACSQAEWYRLRFVLPDEGWTPPVGR